MAELNGNSQTHGEFSWREAHPIFVILLIGLGEVPFAIQRDFLYAHSEFFRNYFDQPAEGENKEGQIEHIIRLPEVTPEVFGLVQNFLYTGRLFSETEENPGYDVLVETWKAADKFEIPRLCGKVLEAMVECRRVTRSIPSTPLLVQAWRETPVGSELRKLLLTWTAEYIRSSESREEFSKSLPQEVLSELVIAMSHLNSAPVIQVDVVPSPDDQIQHKNIHYLEAADSGTESPSKAAKKPRSDVPSKRRSLSKVQNGNGRKALPGPSGTVNKRVKRKRSSAHPVDENQEFTTEQKLAFCSDLMGRMLSGPGKSQKLGFWTRFVGPFREPVDPVKDNVPDYFEKVAKPMDLSTIQRKLGRNEYANADEFAADVRQIFTNCHTYWDEEAPIRATCDRLEKRFEEKYGEMRLWLASAVAEDAA
ncbi:hypothetical protein SLS62_002686 [Diatrype stigma]|uniref:Uncharacterized protein n=1 Tax=Diatrype stigma TaxID=117547 RepID=A0AAN9YRX6_9PEZI